MEVDVITFLCYEKIFTILQKIIPAEPSKLAIMSDSQLVTILMKKF
jgi:hypothetical protein